MLLWVGRRTANVPWSFLRSSRRVSKGSAVDRSGHIEVLHLRLKSLMSQSGPDMEESYSVAVFEIPRESRRQILPRHTTSRKT